MIISVNKLQKAEDRGGWTSSKGNQNKWFDGENWYKEDGLGYEALSEVLVSRLLERTTVETFVRYEKVALEKGGFCHSGCCSADFMMPEDEKIISVERLFQAYRGESAAKAMLRYTSTQERIQYLVENVEDMTGLENFGCYLKKIVTVDTLFLNEDRHFHNLAVIQRKDGTFRECPVFDNGAALFSDVKGGYPLEMELEACYEKIEAKPFSRDFDEQLDACEILFGGFSFQAFFTMKDVETVLKEFQDIYEERILNRVYDAMCRQMRKYSYLF